MIILFYLLYARLKIVFLVKCKFFIQALYTLLFHEFRITHNVAYYARKLTVEYRNRCRRNELREMVQFFFFYYEGFCIKFKDLTQSRS